MLPVFGVLWLLDRLTLRDGGIAAPRLAFHRHHVGVAGEDQAAGRVGSDAGPQVGFRLAIASSRMQRE